MRGPSIDESEIRRAMMLRKLLLSPLVHFFAIGAGLFVLYSVLDDAPPSASRDEIVVTPQEVAQLGEQFAATWKRAPSPEELDKLVQAWVLEEAYVREALALGLDQGDRVIRQRLATKMQFLAESGAAALEADDAALQAFLEAHPERFEQPAQIGFDQILLSAQQDESEIAGIRVALQEGADPARMGRASLLPASIAPGPAPAVDRQFGTGFCAALAELDLGRWQGPVQSAYGLHLVRVTARSPAHLPALAEIRARVEAEWRADRAAQMREAFGEALVGRYSVRLPEPSAEPAQ